MLESEYEADFVCLLDPTHAVHQWLRTSIANVAKVADFTMKAADLRAAWRGLDEIERKVIRLHYGIGGSAMNWPKVTAELGLSARSRARAIHHGALRKLLSCIITWPGEGFADISGELTRALERVQLSGVWQFKGGLTQPQLNAILTLKSGYLWWELVEALRRIGLSKAAERIVDTIREATNSRWTTDTSRL